MPIDAFLRSLAEDQGDNAVAIVLSGTGSDGTLGLRAVQGAGGLCLVQDPATAKYDGMPQSALNSGLGLQALPIASMLAVIRANTQQGTGSTEAATSQRRALAPVRRTGRHPAAAGRRHRARFQPLQEEHHRAAHRTPHGAARHRRRRPSTLRYLKEHPVGAAGLVSRAADQRHQLLPRPEAFEVLKRERAARPAGRPARQPVLRVWVAGCATGEEAYSIAMVLRELMDEGQARLQGPDLRHRPRRPRRSTPRGPACTRPTSRRT